MKYTAALILAAAATANADCAMLENNNCFNKLTNLIQYKNLVTSGTYKAVSFMDSAGTCNFEDKPYSGPIAPFDEELSIHVRGPARLKQFAVYTPNTASKKREEHKSHRRHNHQHLHKKHAEEKAARAVGDLVTATINGQVAVWTNTYDGSSGSGDSPVAAAAVPTPNVAKLAAAASKTTSSTKSGSTSTTPVGDYSRVSYYNAESQDADNVAFLGNYGGDKSGVFDYKWGMSTSYLNADGTAGAESSTPLKNVLVGDNKEFSIWTAQECADGDADCGYYRPGSVAHHGWKGANKVFLFEFTMPMSGNRDGLMPDAPAIWALNAKIPRTGQYSECSCWGSDCGESDFFEVLAPGDTKAKSTFHFLNALGSSDYLDRPTDKYIKMAAVFQESSSSATIKIIDSAFDFSAGLTNEQISSFTNADDDLLATIESFF